MAPILSILGDVNLDAGRVHSVDVAHEAALRDQAERNGETS